MMPDISLSQLRNLNVSRDLLDDLLVGRQEMVETYLETGLRLGVDATETTGAKVVGVGLTEHVVDDRPTGGPAVLLLVDKLDSGGGFPVQTSRGAPVVVEEVGEIQPSAGFRIRYRPILPGVSIAPSARAYSGTLGCFVSSNGVRYLLSCNHVLADVNTIAPGPGATITQQSIEDGGAAPADVIGSLAFSVPIVIGGVSAADAALAGIADGIGVDPRIIRDSSTVERMVAPVTAPVLGMAVQKSGRTTGYTKAAKVTAIGLTFNVAYAAGPSTFNNGFTVKRTSGLFSDGGDSGSAITTDPGNQPVGLIIAGDTAQKLTYANTMSDVLTALAVQTGAAVSVVY